MTLLNQSSNIRAYEPSQIASPGAAPGPSLSLRVAAMVARCSAAAQTSSELRPEGQSAHQPLDQIRCVDPRDLQVASKSVSSSLVRSTSGSSTASSSNKRSREQSTSPSSHHSYSHPRKKPRLTLETPYSHPSTSHPTPTRELRTIVPQSYTVDQTRSIVFGKSPEQPLGVSVTTLLQRKASLYGGDQPLNRSVDGATLILEWPGYQPTTTHLRFEDPKCPYSTRPGTVGRKIRLNEFAVALAEKIQLWLCLLSRHQYDREEKDWELAVECVPPLDELVLVASEEILIDRGLSWIYRYSRVEGFPVPSGAGVGASDLSSRPREIANHFDLALQMLGTGAVRDLAALLKKPLEGNGEWASRTNRPTP